MSDRDYRCCLRNNPDLVLRSLCCTKLFREQVMLKPCVCCWHAVVTIQGERCIGGVSDRMSCGNEWEVPFHEMHKARETLALACDASPRNIIAAKAKRGILSK
jgi:hypothetical protein